jgi:alanyl-tRNA synthetase
VLADVEARVNDLLAADLQVHAEIMSQQEAIAAGALALFGEKYGEQVRVVSVGEWARELCGGTHVRRSGQLGLVKLLGESSIGQGVRRVEALVGVDAYRFLAREHVLVAQLTEALKVRPEELPDRVSSIVTQLRDAQRDIERMRQAQLLAGAASLAEGVRDVAGTLVVAHQVPADTASADDLRTLALDVRGRLPGDRAGVVVVAGVTGERPVVVVAVNETGRNAGLKAGQLIRTAAQTLGGGGGGKDDVAQGGGSDPTKVGDALREVERAIAATGES